MLDSLWTIHNSTNDRLSNMDNNDVDECEAADGLGISICDTSSLPSRRCMLQIPPFYSLRLFRLVASLRTIWVGFEYSRAWKTKWRVTPNLQSLCYVSWFCCEHQHLVCFWGQSPAWANWIIFASNTSWFGDMHRLMHLLRPSGLLKDVLQDFLLFFRLLLCSTSNFITLTHGAEA